MVGGNMSNIKAWDDTISRLKSRLSKWKLNTLSIGGRLTYSEGFFNGVQHGEKKITWVKWSKVLASKKYGGLGVSSFYALNRALLFKWVWRFISKDNSLWSRLISSIHGSQFQAHSFRYSSTWNVIVREVNVIKNQGIDLLSHCKIRVGSGLHTSFWNAIWLGDSAFSALFPRIYALETNKNCTMADNLDDRWRWDLNGEGIFRVQDARNLLDEFFLPKDPVATRWVKSVPIKVNVFVWKLHLDRLPTRVNLARRGVQISSMMCPLCNNAGEDSSHLFFGCDMAIDITRLVCRWWHLAWTPVGSFSEWLAWFKTIRMGSKVKGLLEGVFYTSWWCLWNFRNQLLFAAQSLRKNVLFDDIISRSFTWSHARCRITTSRYVVPTGRVKVPAGRYVVPTSKDNVIVSAGRTKVIPAGRTILVLVVLSELIV
ncbi:RNA-directed DNA polymerase, eukaryota [Tanacetum coccineum]